MTAIDGELTAGSDNASRSAETHLRVEM